MESIQIPVANPLAAYQHRREEIDAAIGRVLRSGWYILGPEVEAFEREAADYLGLTHFLGVANGTDALEMCLRALGVTQGDEVIVPSHTAVATAAAVHAIGAVPVFADIDPGTRCLSAATVGDVLSPKTKAVIVVHIYGQPADMKRLVQFTDGHGLALIEDCAQSFGAAIGGQKMGTFGAAAAFSFYPTKNLGALGDGGGVGTANPRVAERLRELRQYGWKERYISSSHGINSRLDEIQAAVLRVRLRHLERENELRREIALRYTAAIRTGDLRAPKLISGTLHAMHLYVLESECRERLRHFLASYGIQTALHYPLPVHMQPAFLQNLKKAPHLPNTEMIAQKILTLPLYPELKEEEVLRICDALREWEKNA